jgi:hypothetical protein
MARRAIEIQDEPWLVRLPSQQVASPFARGWTIESREVREPTEMLGGCLG